MGGKMVVKQVDYKQYFTPGFLASYLIGRIQFESPESIIDLAVGEGMLLKQSENRWKNSKLFGVDIDKNMISKCKTNCPRSNLVLGDSLEDGTIRKLLTMNQGYFDLGVANPPFKNELGRKFNRIEGYFIQQYHNIIKTGGILAIILPNGILANSLNKNLREYILSHFSVKDIIALPERIFSQVDTKVSILLLKKELIGKNHQSRLYKVDKNLKIVKDVSIKTEDLLDKMNIDFFTMVKYKSQKYPTVKIVGFIDSFRRGYTKYGEKRYFVSTGLHYLHSYHITDLGIDFTQKELFIEPESIMDNENAHVEVGDIVMVRVGRNKAGLMAVINETEDMGVASDCVNIIKVKNINVYYFVLLFKTKLGKKMLKGITHGTGANIISKLDFLNLELPIIPMKSQEIYAESYKKILEKNNDKNNLEELNNLIKRLETDLEG